ncbi:FKBP-type peptidyl-prolyl cis-trans isomerase [Plectosphaerella plurivora]|uniref:FK506-binding protein n=1 Tax=Plectosphaerella plurivora TaxID=936078 RepID=A0A9P9AD19_9PEZI|nr:FKBP-type peptidyl-prolyl cis-trans isomerase [Plectosphaerella plurivora]
MAPQPVALYGLEVPPGLLVPAAAEFPASFRITMAAVDPTEAPQADDDGNIPAVPRSTLRLVKQRFGAEIDEDDEIDEEYMKALLEASAEDEEDDSEEESNGGPSDPKKKKAAQLIEALKKAEAEESDEEMAEAKPKGKKGKGKAAVEVEEEDDDEDDEEDSDEEDEEDLEQFVICTLDTERTYQQPIDIHVGENERVFFLVNGTHAVHLTGNYVIDDEEEEGDSDDEDDEEDMYDLDGELLGGDSDSEEDDLDDLENPRVMEVDSEEEAPKLVAKKGKNKRAAEEAEGLDDLITKDDKASKKAAKKTKNNKGEAVAIDEKADAKKVQFAKNLEQGPTGSAAKAKQAGKGGVKVVNGVTIDDRKIGEGRVVKNGDNVGVRYIGKLENGKVFDANKKGKPFSFKAGKGQVIKGWDIGILGMAIGGERRMTIPAHLAYGSKGLPGIPANSTLMFDVKLLEIK